MLDFTFYDVQTASTPVRVTPYMSHDPHSLMDYNDEVAFAAIEMGYISGPSLNASHHPVTQH